MSSARKLAANRANARRSTGPKTAAGRARSARNAVRHGLSVPVLADPERRKEAMALAARLGGTPDLALAVARATLDVERVRERRDQLLTSALAPAEGPDQARALGDIALELIRLDAYERRTLSRQKSALRAFTRAAVLAADLG
jgi:hypothetical protein